MFSDFSFIHRLQYIYKQAKKEYIDHFHKSIPGTIITSLRLSARTDTDTKYVVNVNRSEEKTIHSVLSHILNINITGIVCKITLLL